MEEPFSDLFQAARLGDIDFIKRYFPDDMPKKELSEIIDAQNWKGETSLHLSSGSGMADVVDFLIQKGASINITDMQNRTPLHQAAAKGFLNCVTSLCDAGAIIDAKDKFGRTPLIAATMNGSHPCVKFLVEHGADVNTFTVRGPRLSPLQAAASGGFTDILDTLIKSGARINNKVKDEDSPLYLAVQNKHPKCIEILLANGADVNYTNAQGETPLIAAATAADDESLDTLLRVPKVNVNAVTRNGETALSICVKTGYMHGVEALLAVPSIKRDQKLAGGTTLVHLAARWCHADVLDVLLRNGCEPDGADDSGDTPLHVAAAVRENHDVVTALVKAGCDPATVGSKGRNVFQCLCPDDVSTWQILSDFMQDQAVLDRIRERQKEKKEKEKQDMKERTIAKREAMKKTKEVTMRTKPKRPVTQKMLVTAAMKGARSPRQPKQEKQQKARPWGGTRETEKFRREVRGQIAEMKKEYVSALADISKDIRALRSELLENAQSEKGKTKA